MKSDLLGLQREMFSSTRHLSRWGTPDPSLRQSRRAGDRCGLSQAKSAQTELVVMLPWCLQVKNQPGLPLARMPRSLRSAPHSPLLLRLFPKSEKLPGRISPTSSFRFLAALPAKLGPPSLFSRSPCPPRFGAASFRPTRHAPTKNRRRFLCGGLGQVKRSGAYLVT
jgi:hypothetical protein